MDSLGLLLGRDLLDGLGGVLDFSEKTLSCQVFGSRPTALERLNAGHLALKLIPDTWPSPGKVRLRRLGPGGVLECTMSCQEWAKQLMRHRSNESPLALERTYMHSHNMTEASLELGRLAYRFYNVLTVSAQGEMTSEPPDRWQDSTGAEKDFRYHFHIPRCPLFINGAYKPRLWRRVELFPGNGWTVGAIPRPHCRP